MSSPTEVAAATDQAPAVPPPGSRKPTASEKADAALALIADLDRKIEQAFESHPDLSSNVHGGLTSDQEALLAKVPGLDTDLGALVEAFNGLSENVDKLSGGVGPATDDAARAAFADLNRAVSELSTRVDNLGTGDGGAVEQLREDVRATLAELRTGEPEGDAPSRQELFDSILALATRVGEVEKRPHLVVDQRTAPRSGVPGVLRKVLALEKMVETLSKDRTAAVEMGGYKFRSIDAAMDAVGNGIRAVGLILRTEIVSHENRQFQVGPKLWTSAVVRARYVFVDPDDGSEHALEMVGEGRDLGDKATSKAVSMAMKYGLLQGLCIPFQGVESDGNSTPDIDMQEQADYAQQAAAERDRRRREEEERELARQENQGPHGGEAAPAAEPVDDRTPEEKAAAVVAALARLNQYPTAEAQARFDRIASAATTQGLTGLIVEGSNIALHLTIHRNLLARAAASSG